MTAARSVLADPAGARERHRVRAESTGERARRRGRQSLGRFVDLLRQRLLDAAVERALPGDAMESIAAEIASRRLDPYAAVERVLGTLGLDARAWKKAPASPEKDA